MRTLNQLLDLVETMPLNIIHFSDWEELTEEEIAVLNKYADEFIDEMYNDFLNDAIELDIFLGRA